MNNFSMIVISFDKYSDLWDTFFECKKRFWHVDMPTYLVTNKKDCFLESVKVIKTGPEISWSRRCREALSSVDCDYVVVMLEDYFVVSEVTDFILQPILNFVTINNVDYLRIYPFPKTTYKSQNKNEVYRLKDNTLYGVNLQPAIWKKSFLLKLLSDDDFSAWEFEARQKNGMLSKIHGNTYTLGYFPFKMVNGVLQGKWYPPAIKQLHKIGIFVDTAHRSVLSWSEVSGYKLKIVVRRLLGPTLIRIFKPMLKKLGFKFVTE